MTRVEFLESVIKLCEEHKASQTSGFRTRKRNTEVGGHPRSRHLTGFAADLVLDEVTPEKIEALQATAYELGITAIDEGDHQHLQPRGPWGRPPAAISPATVIVEPPGQGA